MKGHDDMGFGYFAQTLVSLPFSYIVLYAVHPAPFSPQNAIGEVIACTGFIARNEVCIGASLFERINSEDILLLFNSFNPYRLIANKYTLSLIRFRLSVCPDLRCE